MVVVGVGEVGGVIARGLLRTQHPVYPVTRHTDINKAAASFPVPQAVVVAVSEFDLDQTLADLPRPWRDRVVLIQNELLPRDWEQHGVSQPTVVSIWFEKKPGQDVKVLMPSPAHGPHAELMRSALDAVKVPCRIVDDANDMVYELVRKNLYILTSNIAGLTTGGTVEQLWQQHRPLALQIAGEIIKLQTALTGKTFAHDKLLHGMVEGFEADPQHKCTGRSAPARLIRALAQAAELGIDTPHLRAVQS